MKIVKDENKKEEKINWDKQQLLISYEGRIVLSSGIHDIYTFQGLEIGGEIIPNALEYCDGWVKSSFKIYEGSITLSND